MRKHWCWWLVWCGCAWALTAPDGWAQGLDFLWRKTTSSPQAGNRDYVPIPFEGDLEALLRAHLERAGQLEPLQDLLKKLQKDLLKQNIDPQNLPKLRLDDPQVHKLVQDWLQKPPANWQLKPEQVQLLQKALQQLPREDESSPVKNNPPLFPHLPPPVQETPRAEPPGWDEEDLVKKLHDWMGRAENSELGDWLRNSPAWRDALGEIQTMLKDRHGRIGWGTERLPRWWGKPEELFRSFLNKDWSGLPKVSLPQMPQVGLPRIRVPGFNWLPRMGRPTAPQVEGWTLLQSLLWLGLFAAGCWLMWTFIRRRRRRLWSRLPPPQTWPVDPQQVATAAQVVQAFDFLALHWLGMQARPWNHRRVAARLGEEDAGTAAAEELADYYEVARYAPATPPGPHFERGGAGGLTPSEIAAARRCLCLLAGVRCP